MERLYFTTFKEGSDIPCGVIYFEDLMESIIEEHNYNFAYTCFQMAEIKGDIESKMLMVNNPTFLAMIAESKFEQDNKASRDKNLFNSLEFMKDLITWGRKQCKIK